MTKLVGRGPLKPRCPSARVELGAARTELVLEDLAPAGLRQPLGEARGVGSLIPAETRAVVRDEGVLGDLRVDGRDDHGGHGLAPAWVRQADDRRPRDAGVLVE